MKKLFLIAAACGMVALFNSCKETECDCTTTSSELGGIGVTVTVPLENSPYKSCKDMNKAVQAANTSTNTIKCK